MIGVGIQSSGGDEIVVWGGRVGGGAKGAGVDDGFPLKCPAATILCHLVGR
jgi:hypothetical protein